PLSPPSAPGSHRPSRGVFYRPRQRLQASTTTVGSARHQRVNLRTCDGTLAPKKRLVVWSFLKEVNVDLRQRRRSRTCRTRASSAVGVVFDVLDYEVGDVDPAGPFDPFQPG